jgi:serine O-acetyltransferase
VEQAAKARARLAWRWRARGQGSRHTALALHHTPWWLHIYFDYRRYKATGDSAARAQGFWASSVYRVSRAALHARPRWLRAVLLPFVRIAQTAAEILTGISLPPECEIGDGLYIGHFGSIVVAREARIGYNCSMAQNVTIGVAGRGPERGAPTIGNRVFIGAHSVIVGRITVGDDAVICAGSVVSRSVPARAVVMGNPARVVSYDGSFDYVYYDGMDVDPARRASLDRLKSLNVGPA